MVLADYGHRADRRVHVVIAGLGASAVSGLVRADQVRRAGAPAAGRTGDPAAAGPGHSGRPRVVADGRRFLRMREDSREDAIPPLHDGVEGRRASGQPAAHAAVTTSGGGSVVIAVAPPNSLVLSGASAR